MLKKSTHLYGEGGPESGILQSHVRRKSKEKEKEMQIIISPPSQPGCCHATITFLGQKEPCCILPHHSPLALGWFLWYKWGTRQ